ncbi:LysR family transcriptional regulator, glycine cleavage system transcriptional activator [Colwellia chukchiensis]|uniref:LysR family transcriptional regulator, glycine cleavage system transcriptional activator n=1 Tax=Colwellia chukchiensis TaxID=641665 RepID=A0A1H7GWB4_9GAMM|nr:LysR substrate-binding domain-containing protein [Colwellia chukchiensis]SEK42358.1 LysR family transcriptional regulator, glycine cleavage system transcriptional activator [Colwellia chukchiensis]
MPRKLPTVISLNCFEVAARTESFTKAAEELCLTQSAVSRQVKSLEKFVGFLLFERVKQRLYLTDAGKIYKQKVKEILDQLESVPQDIIKRISGRLVIGVEDTLTITWLIPKLNDFKNKFPDIEVEIMTDLDKLYVKREGFDVGIIYGDAQWPECKAQYLMDEHLVAVCTPELYEQYGEVDKLKDVLNYPFLQHTAKLSCTVEWLTAAGLTPQEIDKVPGPRFERLRYIVEAAEHGLGIAIVPYYQVANLLSENKLVLARKKHFKCIDAYYVVSKKSKADDLKIKEFSKWLLKWNSH